jgi:hypothetical protein
MSNFNENERKPFMRGKHGVEVRSAHVVDLGRDSVVFNSAALTDPLKRFKANAIREGYVGVMDRVSVNQRSLQKLRHAKKWGTGDPDDPNWGESRLDAWRGTEVDRILKESQELLDDIPEDIDGVVQKIEDRETKDDLRKQVGRLPREWRSDVAKILGL